MCRGFVTLVLVLAAATASAQVTVQEYPLPPRLLVHDVWADPTPDARCGSPHSGVASSAARSENRQGRTDPLGRTRHRMASSSMPRARHAYRWGPERHRPVRPKTKAVINGRCRVACYVNLNTASSTGPASTGYRPERGLRSLDPKTGDLKVFDAPKGRGPYGIHATPEGVVYYASLRARISRASTRRPARRDDRAANPGAGGAARLVGLEGSIWVSE